MKKYVLWLALFLVGSGVLLMDPVQESPTVYQLQQESHAQELHCGSYDADSFQASFDGLETRAGAIEKKQIRGGIVPHHLVAAPMIARFFTALKQAEAPETIIVLAPNHKRVGDRPLHTGDFTWDTPFGKLEADQELVKSLTASFGAGIDAGLLEKEHSIEALVPYIRYSFPEAKLVPVLIHGNMDRKTCRKLADFLSKAAGEKSCLILASIDFSHGLEPREALLRDEFTQQAICARDYGTILSLDNTYLDAPPTLCTFLMTMEDLERKDGENKKGGILEHGDASEFLKIPVPETTTYMTYLY